MGENQHENIPIDMAGMIKAVKNSIIVLLKRLGGCIPHPIDLSFQAKGSRDGHTEVLDDAGKDTKFDNVYQKSKYNLLNSEKMYANKKTGNISAGIHKGGVAIIIPKGKLSLVGPKEFCKSNEDDAKPDSNYAINDMGHVLFSDDRIRNTINEVTGETAQKPKSSDATETSQSTLSHEEDVILSYALICLRSRFNYTELKCVFDHICNFENRFPNIANSLFENMDRVQLLQLKRQILRTRIQGGCSIDPRFIVTAPSDSITIPGGIRMPQHPTSIENISTIHDEDSLKKKKELLKLKLLAGEHIKLEGDISDSNQEIKIPRGGLF